MRASHNKGPVDESLSSYLTLQIPAHIANAAHLFSHPFLASRWRVFASPLRCGWHTSSFTFVLSQQPQWPRPRRRTGLGTVRTFLKKTLRSLALNHHFREVSSLIDPATRIQTANPPEEQSLSTRRQIAREGRSSTWRRPFPSSTDLPPAATTTSTPHTSLGLSWFEAQSAVSGPQSKEQNELASAPVPSPTRRIELLTGGVSRMEVLLSPAPRDERSWDQKTGTHALLDMLAVHGSKRLPAKGS